MYNWILKVCFIVASLTIVYTMRFGAPQKATYNAEADAFPVQYLLAPCAVLGIIINQDHRSPFEMVWAFSIYLEALAILPQLFLLQKQGEVRLPALRSARAPRPLSPPAGCSSWPRREGVDSKVREPLRARDAESPQVRDREQLQPRHAVLATRSNMPLLVGK